MNEILRILLFTLVIISVVIVGSIISVRLFAPKVDEIKIPAVLVIDSGMTLEEISRQNGIPNSIMRKVFHLSGKEDLEKKFSEYNFSIEEANDLLKKQMAYASEDDSKVWKKILMKFLLWFMFLMLLFHLVKSNIINPDNRKWYYFAAVIIFGVILGADPGPMGTIKETIVLYGMI